MRAWIWLCVVAVSACKLPNDRFYLPDAPPEIDALQGPPPFGQKAYVKASNTEANDLFGLTLALSADGATLAVGARGESSASTNQADNSAMNAGAVYVFARSGTSWVQQAYLKASNVGAGDMFGSSLSLSGDGTSLVVGAPVEASNTTGVNTSSGADNSAMNSGAAYVFVRSGSSWSQQAYVKASNTGAGDRFGASVAMSVDGTTLAVGAPGESSATGTSQTDDSLVGAGAAYVFTRSGGTWSQQGYIKATTTGQADSFGSSLSLSGDGSTLAVGALYEDSCATGVDGTGASDNSCANAGATYIFTRTGTAWAQQAYLKAYNTEASDSFGSTVRLSGDGTTLAVGTSHESSKAIGINGDGFDRYASSSGAVYLFVRSGTSWSQQAFIKASNAATNDFFGYSVALSTTGSTLAVGASEEDSAATGVGGDATDNNAVNSGAVYVFTRTQTTWMQSKYVKPLNTQAGGDFAAVVMSGDGATLAVGADGESSSATGVGGNETDTSAANSGAVYVFQ